MPSGVLAPRHCLARLLVRLTQLDQNRLRMYCLLKYNLLLRNARLHNTFRQAARQPTHALCMEVALIEKLHVCRGRPQMLETDIRAVGDAGS
jgi:hypothetical protein